MPHLLLQLHNSCSKDGGSDVSGVLDVSGGSDVSSGSDVNGGSDVRGGSDVNGGSDVSSGLDVRGGIGHLLVSSGSAVVGRKSGKKPPDAMRVLVRKPFLTDVSKDSLSFSETFSF